MAPAFFSYFFNQCFIDSGAIPFSQFFCRLWHHFVQINLYHMFYYYTLSPGPEQNGAFSIALQQILVERAIGLTYAFTSGMNNDFKL